MDLAYFSDAGNIIRYQDHPDGGIIGEALIFYEGLHPDNLNRQHKVPAERIQLLASNTNAEYNQGRDIPLKFEHRPSLVDKNGAVNEFGKMASAVSCRPIEEKDLANPRLKNLVGKMGAFAQVHILDKVDEVKKKTIKALSAGIDPIANKIVEISAVSKPSLAGAALLFSQGDNYTTANFASHGITDYEEAWEAITAWEKPHAELQKRFDVFLGNLQAIAAQEETDAIAFNSNNLKRKALEGFVEHLIDYLKIDMEQDEAEPEDIYSSNAYEPNLINPNTRNFNQEKNEDNILNFNQPNNKRAKRSRRGANY